MKTKEVITITKIEGKNVGYSGSKYFSGCVISNFPDRPEVGKKYILISDFSSPSIIKKIKA